MWKAHCPLICPSGLALRSPLRCAALRARCHHVRATLTQNHSAARSPSFLLPSSLASYPHPSSVALGGPLDLLELLTPVMALTVFLLSALWERLWGLGASPYFESIQHSLITLSVIAVGQ